MSAKRKTGAQWAAEVEKLRSELAESNRLLEAARAQLSLAMPAVASTDRKIEAMKREVDAAEKRVSAAHDLRQASERENNRLHMSLSEARRRIAELEAHEDADVVTRLSHFHARVTALVRAHAALCNAPAQVVAGEAAGDAEEEF